MASNGKGGLEKVNRFLRTLYFMVAMLASLLVLSAPVLVAVGDVLVPCVLISSFTCVRCYSLKEHLQRYGFRNSLTDIPLVSVFRSLIITCAYTLCDGPALSHRTYLGTVTLCSIASVLLLCVKACVFSVTSQFEAETSPSIARHKLHLKKSWGMPVLLLSSVVFALGHMVVAYRTSCRARRKLLFHRVDAEAVLSCKAVFSGYQKVPRSPTPSAGKTPNSESRRKHTTWVREEREVPARFLADVDSLFVSCGGLTLHYKLILPDSASWCLSATTIINKPTLNVVSKSQYNLHRSYSSQLHSGSLYTPLLDGCPTSPVLSEDMPRFSLDEADDEKELSKSGSLTPVGDQEADGHFGVILVHGFGGGVFSWRNVMGAISQQIGCAVVAFDRPGWGLSSRPRRKDWEENQLANPYKLDSQVDLLLCFCMEMGFSSVVLVGHDDGGLLALKAAQRAQSSAKSANVEVKAVVLLNFSLSRELVPAFARILLRTSLGKKHVVRPLLRTEITQVVNRRAWYDATKLTTEVLNLYKAPLYVEGWDEALHEIGKLSFETVLSQQNTALLLKAVEDLPILVVAGAEDALVPIKSVQAMASRIINSRLVAISGCGHLPHEECPKALLAAILPFITKVLAKPELPNH